MKALIAWIVLLALVGSAVYLYTAPSSSTPEPQPTDQAEQREAPASSELAGLWQSTDDAKFTREFRADGTVVDAYEGNGSATSEGRWAIVDDVADEPVSLPPVEGTVLRITFFEETLYFQVVEVTEDELVLMYLSGNGTLRFSRVR